MKEAGWLILAGIGLFALSRENSPSPAAPPSQQTIGNTSIITASPFAPGFQPQWTPLLNAPVPTSAPAQTVSMPLPIANLTPYQAALQQFESTGSYADFSKVWSIFGQLASSLDANSFASQRNALKGIAVQYNSAHEDAGALFNGSGGLNPW